MRQLRKMQKRTHSYDAVRGMFWFYEMNGVKLRLAFDEIWCEIAIGGATAIGYALRILGNARDRCIQIVLKKKFRA